MKYTYSTKTEGIEFECRAVTADKSADRDDASIEIVQKIKASSHREAAEQFEKYLNEKHEGFTWTISVLTDAEKKAGHDPLVWAA